MPAQQGLFSQTSVLQRPSPPHTPLSFEQQREWVLSQLIPDLPVCTKGITLRLPGALDIDALEQGLNEVVRRHDIWRTSFPLHDADPVQVVHPPAPLSLPRVDLRFFPRAEREREFLRRTREAVRLPFELAQGPLLRATLFRLGEADHRLCLTLHSIIADDVSCTHLFLSELGRLYTAFARGKPSPLPALPIQYSNVAARQREQSQEDGFAEHLAYWKQQLAGAPTLLELPTDHVRPAAPPALPGLLAHPTFW